MTSARVEKWAAAVAIANAILDENLANHLDIRVSQINGPNDFGCPIMLDVGLTEDRYDQLREIVNSRGGKVIVLDKHDPLPHTIRIWP